MESRQSLIKSTALKDVLASPIVKSRLTEILGNRAPQFAAALVQIQARSFQLQKCDGYSIVGAAITAAALDLSIDPQLGEAHLVPYKDRCAFQLGYIGLAQLAQRSGQYRRLGWCVVHAGELVRYDELDGELELDPQRKQADDVIGYAAKFTLSNGFQRAEYWTRERVEEHARRYSQAYRVGVNDESKRDSAWWTDFDKMSLKTVLKSLLRTWGPKSVQMRQAVVADEAAIDLSGEVQGYPDNDGEAPAPSKPELPAPTPTPVMQSTPVPTPPAPPKTTRKSSAVKAQETLPAQDVRTVKLTAIRSHMVAVEVGESELIETLVDMGAITPETKTLDAMIDETVFLLADQIETICREITAAKSQPTETLL